MSQADPVPLVDEILMTVQLDDVQRPAPGERADGGVGDGMVSADNHGEAAILQDRADAGADAIEVGPDLHGGDAHVPPVGHPDAAQDPPLPVEIVPALGAAFLSIGALVPRVLPPRRGGAHRAGAEAGARPQCGAEVEGDAEEGYAGRPAAATPGWRTEKRVVPEPKIPGGSIVRGRDGAPVSVHRLDLPAG